MLVWREFVSTKILRGNKTLHHVTKLINTLLRPVVILRGMYCPRRQRERRVRQRLTTAPSCKTPVASQNYKQSTADVATLNTHTQATKPTALVHKIQQHRATQRKSRPYAWVSEAWRPQPPTRVSSRLPPDSAMHATRPWCACRPAADPTY